MNLTDDQQQIVNILRQQVLAEQETANQLRIQNELATASLAAVERVRQAESIRNRTWFNIAELTANLIQTEVPEIKLLLHGFAEKLDSFEHHLERMNERLERLELGLLLLLSGRGNGNQSKIKALARDIEVDHKQSLLLKKYHTLNQLQEQLADYAPSARPVHMLNQVNDLEEEIDILEKELE